MKRARETRGSRNLRGHVKLEGWGDPSGSRGRDICRGARDTRAQDLRGRERPERDSRVARPPRRSRLGCASLRSRVRVRSRTPRLPTVSGEVSGAGDTDHLGTPARQEELERGEGLRGASPSPALVAGWGPRGGHTGSRWEDGSQWEDAGICKNTSCGA